MGKELEVSYVNTVSTTRLKINHLCLADHFSCEHGWIKRGTHCFKGASILKIPIYKTCNFLIVHLFIVFTEHVHHADAQKICRQKEATLAVRNQLKVSAYYSRFRFRTKTGSSSFWPKSSTI